LNVAVQVMADVSVLSALETVAQDAAGAAT